MANLPDCHQIIFNALIPGTPVGASKLDTAYVEFSNSGSIAPDTLLPTEIRPYLDSLSTNPSRDYLRVAVMSHVAGKTSSGDTKLTVVIVTDGDTGVHGKPFSAATGSTVTAVILAASTSGDRGDLLFARHQYAESEQLVKPASGNVMLTLDLV